MPTHNPNMSSTLAIVRLLQKIEQTVHTIPKLIQHLLMSDNSDYQATMSTIRSPHGTHLILNSLLHTCHSTVAEWVIEVVMEMFRHKILKASDIETGLHLKASQAHSSDLMNFNLQHIANRLEYAAPLTWGVIHALLDARSDSQLERKGNLQQAVNYESQHIEDIDNLPMVGDRTCVQAEMEPDEGGNGAEP